MAWTSADLASIETAIREIIANPAKSVSINGRSYTRFDLSELRSLRDEISCEVVATANGVSLPVAFEEVDD